MHGGGAITNADLPDFDDEFGVLRNYDGIVILCGNLAVGRKNWAAKHKAMIFVR